MLEQEQALELVQALVLVLVRGQELEPELTLEPVLLEQERELLVQAQLEPELTPEPALLELGLVEVTQLEAKVEEALIHSQAWKP